MASLYFKILEYYNQISLSDYEQHQYSLNINEIKHILTGTQRNLPSAQIVLKTNFASADIEKVGSFHYIIEKCLTESELSTDDFTIEIRHNSNPLSFWITIIHEKVPVIISAVGGLLTTVSGDPAYFLTAMDILGNAATIGTLMLQIYNKENKEKSENNATVLPDNIVSYHKQLTKRKIKISINSAHLNFDYENYRESVR